MFLFLLQFKEFLRYDPGWALVDPQHPVEVRSPQGLFHCRWLTGWLHPVSSWMSMRRPWFLCSEQLAEVFAANLGMKLKRPWKESREITHEKNSKWNRHYMKTIYFGTWNKYYMIRYWLYYIWLYYIWLDSNGSDLYVQSKTFGHQDTQRRSNRRRLRLPRLLFGAMALGNHRIFSHMMSYETLKIHVPRCGYGSNTIPKWE